MKHSYQADMPVLVSMHSGIKKVENIQITFDKC